MGMDEYKPAVTERFPVRIWVRGYIFILEKIPGKMKRQESSIIGQYNQSISLIKYHTDKDYLIGIMRKDLKEFKEHYSKGRLVLYKNNTDLETITIGLPVDANKITKDSPLEEYIFLEHPLLNVPKEYVEKFNSGFFTSKN